MKPLFFAAALLFSILGFGAETESQHAHEIIVSTVDIQNPGLFAETAIMTEAYSRMGIHIKVVRLPAQRALPDVNAGKYDAELYRVAAVGKEYPNLRRVPTPIGSIDFVAYGKKKMLSKITDWQSLKPYRLAAQLGIKFIEYNTRGMNISFVSRGEQLIQMLHLDRIDIILLDRNTMLETMKRVRSSPNASMLDEIQEIKMLNSQPLYHYVHKKNENLIPEIDLKIQELKKEGFIKKTWDEFRL